MFRSSGTTLAVPALAWLALVAPSAFAGSLNPPAGPVAATAKPIAEAEPRVMLSATATPGDANSIFKITQPGSYYLGANVVGAASKNGIEIDASDVTLDLNGFEIQGVASSRTGVLVEGGGRENFRMSNGFIRGWGMWCADMNLCDGSAVDRVTFLECGNGGLRTGPSTIVTHCVAMGNLGTGIIAHQDNVIDSCVAKSNQGSGITAGTGSVVSDCTSADNDGTGITVGSTVIVKNCVAATNGTHGISAGDACLVIGNTARQNGQVSASAGILVTGISTRVEDNNVTGNLTFGIKIDGTKNFIVKNTAGGHTTDYQIAAPNTYGEIWNAGGGLVITSSPWANWKLQ